MSNIEIGNWKLQIVKHPTIFENPEYLRIITDRLEGQYFPALELAKDTFAQQKVWLAFWTYLTSRYTIRKPFQFNYQEADNIIDIIQSSIKYI